MSEADVSKPHVEQHISLEESLCLNVGSNR